MTADLEETLGALGADFRDFAVRFRRADAVCASPRLSRGSGTFRMFAASAAAAAVAAAAILPVFVGKTAAPETAAPRASVYVLAFSGEIWYN